MSRSPNSLPSPAVGTLADSCQPGKLQRGHNGPANARSSDAMRASSCGKRSSAESNSFGNAASPAIFDKSTAAPDGGDESASRSARDKIILAPAAPISHYRITCPLTGLAVRLHEVPALDGATRIVPQLVDPKQADCFTTRTAARNAFAEYIGVAVLEIERVDA